MTSGAAGATTESEKKKEGARARSDFHVEDILDRPFDRNLALRLFGYVRPYRAQVVLSLLLIAASTLLQLLGPILIKEAIDGPLAVDAHGSYQHGAAAFLLESARWSGIVAPGGEVSRHALLLWIVLLYGTLLMFAFAARYAQSMVMNDTGQRVMRDLRVALFAKLQRQSLRFFQGEPVGRLVTRVTSDVESLNELFTSGFVTFIGDMLTVGGIVVFMFLYDARLAALALAVSPFLLALTFLFRARSRKHYREIRRTLAHLNAFTQESITGMEIIQISRREDARAARYAEINDGYMSAYLKAIFWHAVFFPGVEICAAVALALVVAESGERIMAGATTFGEFFLFWSYLNRFFIPIRDLAEKYNLLQAAMASAERVFRIIDTDTSLPETPHPQTLRPLQESIRFENVSFAYDDRTLVLKDVDFELRRGETVALVGATGAGKSTIVNLLLRLHDPTRGRILIDGIDAREFSAAAHRGRFGLVLQDVAIFSRDVHANIDLDRGIPHERVRQAAEQVQAHRFIAHLEHGYQQVMKERGRTLSSGERQLLAFARALAGSPEILVLDEATSHIDAESEALIQEALANLTAGRTSLIIAHRLSTVRHAHRILVFHHGELREEGNHEALLARGGIYARLYQLQFGAGTAA